MRIGLAGVGRIGAFHAATLRELPQVEEVVIADADVARATSVAHACGARAVPSVADLLRAGLDALVIATATDAHTELILAGVEAGVPTFCEKPVAEDAAATRAVLDKIRAAGTTVQIGFQRRYDAGYTAARAAVATGELGWVHTLRAGTLDAAPPPAAYIPTSGGFFRDCSVHDFDIVRWVSGQQIVEVYALGANRGEDFFRDAGDVDTAAALLTLSDGTFAHVMGSRYNAAGYDVRLEVLGSRGSVSVGLDDGMPLRSAETGVEFPAGPAYASFMPRFHDAYVAELTAFTQLAADPSSAAPVPGVEDALQAILVAEACELSRQRHRPVALSELSS